VTVTYILKGGFTHHDSLGIIQIYGAEKQHKGKHTRQQGLTRDARIPHEENEPLGEPNKVQRSMVMDTPEEINMA
jgi:redox-sensitive bicupin YhaK (pirin superfamily)